MAKKRTPRSTTAELVPWEHNPRQITERQAELLKRSMDRFGDLSGIVFNRKNGKLVGGHQRVRFLPDAPIRVVEEYDEPDEQGTVAWGFAIIAGSRWQYREVEWDDFTHAAANVSANQNGGGWDWPMLTDIVSTLEAEGFDATLTGFDETEIENMMANWHGGPGSDPGEYDEDADTLQVRINGIARDEGDTVVEVVQKALDAAGMEYRAKAL